MGGGLRERCGRRNVGRRGRGGLIWVAWCGVRGGVDAAEVSGEEDGRWEVRCRREKRRGWWRGGMGGCRIA